MTGVASKKDITLNSLSLATHLSLHPHNYNINLKLKNNHSTLHVGKAKQSFIETYRMFYGRGMTVSSLNVKTVLMFMLFVKFLERRHQGEEENY